MGLWNAFKKATGINVGGARRELKKFEHKDLLEAFTGATMLMRSIGKTRPDEEALADIRKVIFANPSTSHFDPSDVNDIVNKFNKMFDAGARTAKFNILKELKDIRSNADESNDVVNAVIQEAERDGNISDEELSLLKEIADAVNVDLASFFPG